jgi:anti-anti-sigma regulatory factor
LKIKLDTEKSIAILSVTETVTSHDVEVLRAGIIKILKTGKNRIVLEIPKNESLPSDVIRELASFDILARELAGRLVLAEVTPMLKSKIEVFAMPPVILTFESRAQALEFFLTPPKTEQTPAPESSASDVATEALRQEQSSFRSRILELEAENKLLKEQIVLATIARRLPADEAGYRERISTLEAQIEKLLLEAQMSQAPSTPAASN